MDVAGVIFDALAVADLAEHLDVEAGALLEAGGFEDQSLLFHFGEALVQLQEDALDGALEALGRGDVVAGGVDVDGVKGFEDLAGEGVDLDDAFEFVAEELEAEGEIVVGRENLDDVAPDPEFAPGGSDIVALVLDAGETAKETIEDVLFADLEGDGHAAVVLGGTDTVNA